MFYRRRLKDGGIPDFKFSNQFIFYIFKYMRSVDFETSSVFWIQTSFMLAWKQRRQNKLLSNQDQARGKLGELS